MAAILSTAPQTVKPVREIPQDSAAKTSRERYGRPIEVARTGTFRIADDASNITSRVIRIDDGQMAESPSKSDLPNWS
jgi:NAD(P)-dependent dehydrogenase (short-subunit alcohol dehydrogenase family)